MLRKDVMAILWLHLCLSSVPAITVISKRGEDATLTCSLPQEMGTLVWDREARTGAIAIGTVVQGNRGSDYTVTANASRQTLTVKGVEPEDSDIYRCYPFSNTESNVVKINLTVITPPVYVQVIPPATTVQEGGIARLTCIAASSRPAAQLNWDVTRTDGESHSLQGATLSDSVHPNSSISRTSEIYVPATRKLYGAVFRCRANISALNYEQTAQTTLYMNVAPLTPTLAPPNPNAVEGVRTFLTCTARDARPAATIVWYWEGSVVNGDVITTPTQNGTYDVTSTLWMTPTENQNGVEFACEVQHPIFSATGRSPYRLAHTLVVQYKPRVRIDEEVETVWEGTEFSVTCSFYANPNDTDVIWLFDDGIITTDNRRSVTTDNKKSTLTVKDSTREDSGIYRCEVTNSIGKAKSNTVTALVLHSPFCSSDQKLQYGVEIGHQTTLKCSVEAVPSALVFFGWRVNGSDWHLMEGYREPTQPTVASATFNYTVTSEEDYTYVYCKAYNGVNEMAEPCTYRVRRPGPAEAPRLCEAANITENSAYIDCRDAYDGGFDASFWLQWRQVGGGSALAANLSEPDFNVRNLQSGSAYLMEVCASNERYWNNISCTEPFSVVTNGRPAAGSVAAYVNDNQNFIIGGVVGSIALVCLVAVVIEVAILRKRDKIRLKENMELYQRDGHSPGGEPEMRERNNLSAVPSYRRSTDLTNIDDGAVNAGCIAEDGPDPIYDSADGLRASLSPGAIQALVRQGQRESVLQSGMHESSVDPEAEASRILHEMADNTSRAQQNVEAHATVTAEPGCQRQPN